MKQWRFEVSNRAGFPDVHGQAVLEEIKELGITSVEFVHSATVFLIEADFGEAFADRVASELLADTVCQEYYVGRTATPAGPMQAMLIEVHLKSGVTDPVARSVVTAIADMGVNVETVRTARKYILLGSVSDSDRDIISRRILANDCIEEVVYGSDAEPPSPHTDAYELTVGQIPITELDEDGLMQVSKDKDMFLTIVEMKTIQDQYRSIGREPTDVELETIAQTWSEHCVHKTLKSSVDMDFDGEHIHFDNLLKETVFKATQDLNKPWCISVFEDNAGVIEFDEDTAVCFKVETHNHPSALDPYGGALTGIVGVNRDPMGTGIGAELIFNTDVFCFGPPDLPDEELPSGILHPRRIFRGVRKGVEDGGNKIGIPTVNGAILFDDGYVHNPLVFCGTGGIMPKVIQGLPSHKKSIEPGDLFMMVGGRIGKDGIHG
ncbi:hypothetical protein LCGC14_1839830, partial [marine sediment metagenome]